MRSIAQVSSIWIETPPRAYGGSQRIVSLLTEELVKRGHEVTLFATADSKTKAKLVPIWPKGLDTDADVGVSRFDKKIQLYRRVKSFLFPIFKREEPFGLVVIEAMACGTPVIAARSGAMSELIIDGENGFLVDTKEEAVQALKKIDTISRKYCRQHVEENFSLKTMVDSYEALYKEILAKNAWKFNFVEMALKILAPKKV